MDEWLHATENYELVNVCSSSICPWTTWPPFRRQYFQMHFHEWGVLYFDQNFTKVCSQWSNWQYPSIGLDNGLAPNRRQAIIWTNADLIHWRIYATLGEDELMACYCWDPWLIEAERLVYVSVTYAIIGSDNGMWPGRHQAIIWFSAGIL